MSHEESPTPPEDFLPVDLTDESAVADEQAAPLVAEVLLQTRAGLHADSGIRLLDPEHDTGLSLEDLIVSVPRKEPDTGLDLETLPPHLLAGKVHEES